MTTDELFSEDPKSSPIYWTESNETTSALRSRWVERRKNEKKRSIESTLEEKSGKKPIRSFQTKWDVNRGSNAMNRERDATWMFIEHHKIGIGRRGKPEQRRGGQKWTRKKTKKEGGGKKERKKTNEAESNRADEIDSDGPMVGRRTTESATAALHKTWTDAGSKDVGYVDVIMWPSKCISLFNAAVCQAMGPAVAKKKKECGRFFVPNGRRWRSRTRWPLLCFFLVWFELWSAIRKLSFGGDPNIIQ